MNYYLQKFLAFKSNDETKLNGETFFKECKKY